MKSTARHLHWLRASHLSLRNAAPPVAQRLELAERYLIARNPAWQLCPIRTSARMLLAAPPSQFPTFLLKSLRGFWLSHDPAIQTGTHSFSRLAKPPKTAESTSEQSLSLGLAKVQDSSSRPKASSFTLFIYFPIQHNLLFPSQSHKL